MNKDVEKVLQMVEKNDTGIGTPSRWALTPVELQLAIDLVVSKERKKANDQFRQELETMIEKVVLHDRELNARRAEKLVARGCPEFIPSVIRGAPPFWLKKKKPG
jgi:hypothetical protein